MELTRPDFRPGFSFKAYMILFLYTFKICRNLMQMPQNGTNLPKLTLII
jgi:hypothetical protein